MPESTLPPHEPFVSMESWNVERPHIMVVCCSDGRLQETTDQFLRQHLGVRHYDRFYAPGGPAALASGGDRGVSAQKYREDAAFLLQAHAIHELFLVFHGPAPDGPAAAVCAQYRRTYPGVTIDYIRDRQAQDLNEITAYVQGLHLSVRVHAYRAEVLPDGLVQFVSLALPA